MKINENDFRSLRTHTIGGVWGATIPGDWGEGGHYPWTHTIGEWEGGTIPDPWTIYIYIYIYIGREWEREVDRFVI